MTTMALFFEKEKLKHPDLGMLLPFFYVKYSCFSSSFRKFYILNLGSSVSDFKFLKLLFQYVMRCAICYHLYNLKNVKKTHGGVLLLVKLQAEALLHTND